MKFRPIKNLRDASILISNDDGIDSLGIKILEQEMRKICRNVTVVAPLSERSGSGHAITAELTALDDYNSFEELPRKIERFDDNHYGVDGTPADCVNIALNMLLAQHKPDLVVSGINLGCNLAEDITYSGTIGAATEALLHGIFAIAFSQQTAGREPDWEIARQYTAPLTEKLAAEPFNINTMLSINYPNVPLKELRGLATARHGERRFPDKKLLQSDWPEDYAELNQNKIVVTPLKIDFTDYDALEKLHQLFN